MNNVKPVVGR